ncbi:hypothetical protein [Eubacterium ramulus]|uniref:hypothetical protein n=1 Tax=Eubacterium ramulus TaxID=39490 RepID=UPI001C028417|nr:hypothetical protein [Eubacterium ramulus]MBT9703015.1 hypothetical protein [Eubacterium ramulus]
MDDVEDVSTNPWIYATREVIEQILLYRGRASGHRVDCESDIYKKTGEEVLESKAAERHDLLEAYREFRPMILDTDSPEQVFGEEDDVDQILEQLYPGLNFLEICTDRPQYFAAFADRMEHECGLIVRILPLAEMHQSRAGMVLDLQRYGELHVREFRRDVIYLPFYKRRWREYREVESQEACVCNKRCALRQKNSSLPENTGEIPKRNLDIEVPIGYNVVIVKVGKTLQKFR